MSKKKAKLKKAVRRLKVIELRVKGYNLEKIAKKLGVNEKTIRRDLKSQQTSDFIDELVRQQLLDINGSDVDVRLRYRDILLGKLLPRKIQSEANVDVKVDAGKAINELLGKYERLFSDGSEEGDIQEDSS